MSEQSVEGVRRGIEAFNRGDIEAVLEGLDPEIEWHVPPIVPEQTIYHGHEGIRALMQSLEDSFDELHLEVEEIHDVGERVMMLAAVAGRGKESGVEVQTPSFGWVWTFRGEKALRVEVYPNRAETMDAVGLDA
jgi:ketosteroid isomerase-like protein